MNIEDLEEYFLDIIYQTNLAQQETLVTLLFEYKSYIVPLFSAATIAKSVKLPIKNCKTLSKKSRILLSNIAMTIREEIAFEYYTFKKLKQLSKS